MKTLKQLYRYFKPYRGKIILYIVLGLAVTAVAMISPYLQKYIFDNLLVSVPLELGPFTLADGSLMLFIAVALLAQCIIRQGVNYIRSIMMERVSMQSVAKMREELMDKLLSQSDSFVRSQNSGNIMTIINGDPELVKNFFVSTIPQAFENTTAMIFGSVMMALISPWSLLAGYIMAPFIIMLSRRAGKDIRSPILRIRDCSANISKCAQENIVGIRLVRALSREKEEIQKFDAVCDDALDAQKEYLKTWKRRFMPLGISGAMPYVLLNVMGFVLVMTGEMSVGDFVATGGYLAYVTNFFNLISGWITQYQQAMTSGEKVFTFLEQGVRIKSIPEPVPLELPLKDITLTHASISVDNASILEDINISLPAGKRLGIMGRTGSGKTMLCNLIMRYYDPVHGNVTLNDTDMRLLDLAEVRKCFSPVMQDVFLFSETIARNIAFYKPDASMEEIVHAAEVAQAYEFIKELPDGFETVIGERGMGLSGGQKQRLSIARALLKDAPVLVLDDASSALDMETEQRLIAALNAEHKDKTVITVAHRIASVKECDEIIYLENGRIVERGTHDELLALGGRYYEVYKTQFGEIKEAV
ncbi:MAG TPA: ABC transporter ATP-binding protein/permease [Firmicutes bacterium]|nr:ABC transporter ATP-binding protein/permease [Bacillota bacterium]